MNPVGAVAPAFHRESDRQAATGEGDIPRHHQDPARRPSELQGGQGSFLDRPEAVADRGMLRRPQGRLEILLHATVSAIEGEDGDRQAEGGTEVPWDLGIPYRALLGHAVLQLVEKGANLDRWGREVGGDLDRAGAALPVVDVGGPLQAHLAGGLQGEVSQVGPQRPGQKPQDDDRRNPEKAAPIVSRHLLHFLTSLRSRPRGAMSSGSRPGPRPRS